MKSYTVLGCVPPDAGITLCLDCCPLSRDDCEEQHGAIFADSEWQCTPPTCDLCLESIEGVRVIHDSEEGICQYCGVTPEDE